MKQRKQPLLATALENLLNFFHQLDPLNASCSTPSEYAPEKDALGGVFRSETVTRIDFRVLAPYDSARTEFGEDPPLHRCQVSAYNNQKRHVPVSSVPLLYSALPPVRNVQNVENRIPCFSEQHGSTRVKMSPNHCIESRHSQFCGIVSFDAELRAKNLTCAVLVQTPTDP